MKIAVVNPTGGGISGGYRSYLSHILPLMAGDSRVESLLCVSPASLHASEWLPSGRKIQFAECPPFRMFGRGLEAALDRTLSSFGPDVIFVPIARTVRFRKVPVVTMIQNMAPLVPAGWPGLREKLRLAAQKFETMRAVREADRVIAISAFVRDFLVREGVNPLKVSSIYFGAPSPSVTPVRPPQIPAGWTDFIFTAGSIDPYRSLEDIVKCVEHTRKKLGFPLRIIIAGTVRECMRPYLRSLKLMAEKAGVAADLCWAGQLSYDEMTWCYRNCRAFVMTSRVEAGPNTVLEAMACGAACIASDCEPLPEFFSGTALYYSPGDSAMLAGRIKEVLSWDILLKTKVSNESVAQSRKFNWETAAKETLSILTHLSASGKI